MGRILHDNARAFLYHLLLANVNHALYDKYQMVLSRVHVRARMKHILQTNLFGDRSQSVLLHHSNSQECLLEFDID